MTSHSSPAYGVYTPLQPMRTHRQSRGQHHHRNFESSSDEFENISLVEQGTYSHSHPHSRQGQQSTSHLNGEDRCCFALAKPSNAISAGSFSLGALSTLASAVLPKIPSLAEKAAVMAAQKPLLYGGIGGMVLGVAIQLGKLCLDGGRPIRQAVPDCGDVDCVDAACCCLACCD